MPPTEPDGSAMYPSTLSIYPLQQLPAKKAGAGCVSRSEVEERVQGCEAHACRVSFFLLLVVCNCPCPMLFSRVGTRTHSLLMLRCGDFFVTMEGESMLDEWCGLRVLLWCWRCRVCA
jgi:hypothetical protein